MSHMQPNPHQKDIHEEVEYPDFEANQAVYEERERATRQRQVERSQLDMVAELTNISLFAKPGTPFRASASQDNVLSENDIISIEARMGSV